MQTQTQYHQLTVYHWRGLCSNSFFGIFELSFHIFFFSFRFDRYFFPIIILLLEPIQHTHILPIVNILQKKDTDSILFIFQPNCWDYFSFLSSFSWIFLFLRLIATHFFLTHFENSFFYIEKSNNIDPIIISFYLFLIQHHNIIHLE